MRKTKKNIVVGLVCGLVLWLMAGAVHATLVGTNSGGQLITIDPITGIGTQFGKLGEKAVGAAFNPLTNTFYARSFSTLFTFDLAGNVTTVGSSGSSITGLTFDSTFATLFSIEQTTGDLFSVNPLTGAAAFIGNTGISFPFGLSTDSAGKVYVGDLTGNVYTVDTSNASATFVTNVSAGLTSIAFDASDVLYGVSASGDFLQVDLLGSPTNIGSGVGFVDVRGLTFYVAAAPIPEPSTMLLLGSGLAGLAAWRRKKAA